MRIKKVICVGAMVAGIGVSAAACAPASIHWETYPTGTSSSLRTAEQHWWVNGGGDAALAANNAQAALTTDVINGSSPSKVAMDGSALAHAAAAAARNPWPGDPSDYATMMNDFTTAGRDYAAGDTTDGANYFEAGAGIAYGQGWETDFPAAPANLTK
jgi:hypothetical protein